MTNSSTGGLTIILYIMIAIMFCLLIVLALVYINMKLKTKKPEDDQIEMQKAKANSAKKIKNFTISSIFDFMEFDKIEDNMIIQKKGNRYVMVIDCQGINYDLMSQAEKVSVEEGFVQFLNTLSHPVQIYTQTRKINLESSLQTYKQEVDKVEQQFQKAQYKYRQVMESPNSTQAQIKQALYEYTKAKNLYEYGKDIIYNTERMSLNKNILSKKYYVVISYYSEEAGNENLSKEEIRELAFSELYTRAQAIIRALSVSGVMGKVMSSTELADLLYVAYNRDEAETYGIDRAIKAGYNELYSTSQDVFAKKIKALDEEIEEKAIDLANSKVEKAKSMLQENAEKKEQNMDELIDELAEIILKDNKSYLGSDISDAAIAELEKDKEGNHEVSKKKTKTRNKSAN